MFGRFRKEALLDAELTAWQFDCFDWLSRHTGGLEALRSRRLILPTRELFPQRGGRDTAFAEAVFRRVARCHAGMSRLAMRVATPGGRSEPHGVTARVRAGRAAVAGRDVSRPG